jgi:hypothetical protein
VPDISNGVTAEQLKAKVLEDKAAYRRHLAKLPIVEKLRLLEEMRDTTRALKKTREENKTRVKSAWTNRWKTPRRFSCWGATGDFSPEAELFFGPDLGYGLDVKNGTKQPRRMSREEIQKPIRDMLPKIEKDFAGVRGRVQRAVEASRRPVTLSSALAQVARFNKASSKEMSTGK